MPAADDPHEVLDHLRRARTLRAGASPDAAALDSLGRETAAAYLLEAPGHLAILHEAVTAGETARGVGAAMWLKRESVILGAVEIARLANRVEMALRRGDPTAAAALVVELADAFSALAEILPENLAA